MMISFEGIPEASRSSRTKQTHFLVCRHRRLLPMFCDERHGWVKTILAAFSGSFYFVNTDSVPRFWELSLGWPIFSPMVRTIKLRRGTWQFKCLWTGSDRGGGGIVVSILAIFSHDSSSNPAGYWIFLFCTLKRWKEIEKGTGGCRSLRILTTAI